MSEDNTNRNENSEKHIDYRLDGLYTETLISNGTTNTILLIDNNGNKDVIPPSPNAAYNGLSIKIRQSAGARYEYGTMNTIIEKSLPTLNIDIPEDIINRSGYYIKEMDLIAVNSQHSEDAKHPNSVGEYRDVIHNLSKSHNSGNHTSIEFYINDPLKRSTTLYGCLNEVTFKIPVSPLPSTEPVAKLLVLVNTEGATSTYYDIVIEDLYTEGSMLTEVFGGLLGIGKTSSSARATMEDARLERDKLLDEKANRLARSKVEAHKAETKSKLDKLSVKVEELTNANNILEQDLKTANNLVSEYKAMMESQATYNKRRTVDRVNEYKEIEQEHKTNKALLSVSSEGVKIIAGVVAIIVTAAVSAKAGADSAKN